MKTNVLVKFAVVAMAAFGAYAFSGSANLQQMFTRSDTCENIIAECDNIGNEICLIKTDNGILPVYDLLCQKEIKHSYSNPVEWN